MTTVECATITKPRCRLKNMHTNTLTLVPLSILVIEDDPIMQQRLCRLVAEVFEQSHQIICAQNFSEALSAIALHNFALALVDLGLPDANGLDCIDALLQKDPSLAILVVTVCSTAQSLLETIKHGARGYLLKERDDFELIIAIKHILNGAMPIDPFMAKIIIDLAKPYTMQKPISSAINLSNREIEILKLITLGLSNKDIAKQLTISTFTVDTHIRNIYAKLAVNNRSKAIAAVSKFKLF